MCRFVRELNENKSPRSAKRRASVSVAIHQSASSETNNYGVYHVVPVWHCYKATNTLKFASRDLCFDVSMPVGTRTGCFHAFYVFLEQHSPRPTSLDRVCLPSHLFSIIISNNGDLTLIVDSLFRRLQVGKRIEIYLHNSSVT